MKLAYETDEGAAAGRGLGLIVLSNDETVEPEIASLLPPGAALYHARIPSGAAVTHETLAAMAAELPGVAALLPRSLAAVGYCCTSGATVIGPGRVAALIAAAHPGLPVADPLTSVIAAAQALGARRIGFLTPYRPEVSAAMRAALEAAGLEIAAFASFEEERESVVARIAERSTREAIRNLAAAPGVEAVFASCTNLRTFGIIGASEQETGKPVISSNLALGWRLMALAGLKPRDAAPGRLMRL